MASTLKSGPFSLLLAFKSAALAKCAATCIQKVAFNNNNFPYRELNPGLPGTLFVDIR